MIALAAAVVVALSPNPSHFGQLVTAKVQGGPPPSFAPFVVRERHGNTYVLQCLDPACVPGPRPRTVTVGGARAVIAPRTTASEVEHPLRSFERQAQVPPPSYRIRPALLRTLTLVVAAALLAAAAALAWPVARRLVPVPRDDRTPLQRALDLVRESLRRDPRDRRRALDLLARVLGGDQRAHRALELAWSRPDPDPPGISSLVETVERER
ncbi:MAG: hypothetical protein ACJ77E_07650 [Gaiellaceae bacterium]